MRAGISLPITVAEDCRVAGAGRHSSAYVLLYRLGTVIVVEGGEMLFPPRQANHHPQAVSLRKVQEPTLRRGVGAYRIQPVRRYLCEISFNSFRAMILAAVLTGSKRP